MVPVTLNSDALYVVLSPDQISNWDLVCDIRGGSPNIQIVAQQFIPRSNADGTYESFPDLHPPVCCRR